MIRRDFLIGAIALASVVGRAAAQQPKKRIALVSASLTIEAGKRDPLARFFEAELKRAGLIEGENVVIDRYSAEGHVDRHEAIAREVVGPNPDLIVTGAPPLTLKLKAATS